MAIDTSEFRNGLKLELDGSPFVMIYFQHVKPGKGGAFVRTKVKNLLTGKVLDRTFRSGEKVNEADVEERKMQYLYLDGEDMIFMDSTSYDQIPDGPRRSRRLAQIPAREHRSRRALLEGKARQY